MGCLVSDLPVWIFFRLFVLLCALFDSIPSCVFFFFFFFGFVCFSFSRFFVLSLLTFSHFFAFFVFLVLFVQFLLESLFSSLHCSSRTSTTHTLSLSLCVIHSLTHSHTFLEHMIVVWRWVRVQMKTNRAVRLLKCGIRISLQIFFFKFFFADLCVL